MSNSETYQKTFWNTVAGAFAKGVLAQTDDANYGPFGFPPGEMELRLLGPSVKGKEILILGFGTGFSAIALAKMGATCTAIDISDEQVKNAKLLLKQYPANIRVDFKKGSFNDLSQFNDQEFDGVFSAYALHFAEDLNLVFNQVARILKPFDPNDPASYFGFSLDHPDFFRLDPETGRLQEKFEPGWIELPTPWHPTLPIKIFQRNISDIIQALEENGFTNIKQQDIHVTDEIAALGIKGFHEKWDTPVGVVFGAQNPALT